jgi:uncharacterized protein YkwD
VFRKHIVLAAVVLLVALGATGIAVSGATAGAPSLVSAGHGRHGSSTGAAGDSWGALTPMIDVPPTTQPAPPETTPPEPAPPEATPAPPPAPSPLPAAPSPSQVAPATSTCSGFGSAILDAVNRDRTANGVAALCGNNQLAALAQNWANWMAQNGSLTHQNLGGLIGSTPFTTMGENIIVAPAGTSVAAIEAAWMNSPAHRANNLSGSFSAAATGIAVGSDGQVWACIDFGG